MINPLWLEKAYIVQNSALDYDKDEEVDSFSLKGTDINAVRYKTFVGSNPTKTTYFQPVLDALEIPFSPLVRSASAIIVEGKYDYHPILFFRGRLGKCGAPEVFPAGGANDIGTLIALFRGWGVNFRVLLDDDDAGRKAKAKYLSDYVLSEHEIATIGDLSSEMTGKAFERLYRDDVRAAVRTQFACVKPAKKHFSLFFQELIATKQSPQFADTEKAFHPISNWLDEQFQN